MHVRARLHAAAGFDDHLVVLQHGELSSACVACAIDGATTRCLAQVVPELSKLANLDLKVLFNKDSSAVGPHEWIQMAKALHASRENFDAFLVRLEIAVKTGDHEEEDWTCMRRDRLRVSRAKLGKKTMKVQDA